MPETKKYLNRDGLEKYNSLLPHSSAEIQEYVNDWLDAHPEATTTVQDGSITTQKLADGSVTRNKLAADVAHLLGGMMVTGEVQGEILSADDAYSIAPLSMEIDGKSTQDGTPTPESPVEIVSLEQVGLQFAGKNLFDASLMKDQTSWNIIEIHAPIGAMLTMSTNMPQGLGLLCYFRQPGGAQPSSYSVFSSHPVIQSVGSQGFVEVVQRRMEGTDSFANYEWQIEFGSTATEYQPYDGTSVLLNLTQALRSLPDGTKDTLALTYIQTSTREGWAWYSGEVTRRVGYLNSLSGLTWSKTRGAATSDEAWKWSAVIPDLDPTMYGATHKMCNTYEVRGGTGASNTLSNGAIAQRTGYNVIYIRDDDWMDVTAAEWDAHVASVEYAYVLATPVTTQLDPIELPVIPAPECTVWSDPATGLKMSYMRDANIVVSNIEQAIADL